MGVLAVIPRWRGWVGGGGWDGGRVRRGMVAEAQVTPVTRASRSLGEGGGGDGDGEVLGGEEVVWFLC